MMRKHNIPRRVGASRVGLGIGLLASLLIGLSASAQGSSPELPDAGDVIRAYNAVRGWLDAFDTPELAEPASRVPIRGSHGVCVILRRSGRVLGTGVDWSSDDLAVRRAAGRAMSEMLSDSVVRSLPEDLLAEAGKRVTLEMEFAAAPTPLVGRTFQELADRVSPGLDGLAARRMDRWVARFPAQMRAINQCEPSLVLPSIIVNLDVPLMRGEWSEARDRYGVSAYRFSTTHLTQYTPDGAPTATFRGGELVSQSAVTPAGILRTLEGVVDHVLGRAYQRVHDGRPADEPLGMLGTYHPTRDAYVPPVATPIEQALVSYALSRYVATPGADPERAGRAAEFADRLLVHLADVRPELESDPLVDVGTCAMVVAAGLESQVMIPLRPELKTFMDRATAKVLAAFDPKAGGFRSIEGVDPPQPLPASTRALVAMAYGRMLSHGISTVTPALLRAAIDEARRSESETQHVNLMPWLGWAEIDYALATGDRSGLERLEDVRSFVWQSQVTADVLSDFDLQGGIVLIVLEGRRVTDQGLRPVAWLAAAAAAPGILPREERPEEVKRLRSFARFVMQLAVTEADGWSYKDMRRALGGLRQSSWNSEQATAAQAFGILVLSDLLRVLEGR